MPATDRTPSAASPSRYESDNVIWEFGPESGEAARPAGSDAAPTSASEPLASPGQVHLRPWVERIKEAEKIDAKYGLYIPGDSALAVVFGAMEEAAYAGDPEFDSRVTS